MPNENVETNQYATNEDKTNGQDGITNDENDVNLYLDDEVQSESYSKILSESNDETSHPSSKEQIIRQHKFYIHSAWLAVQSSYFRSLFFSGMKESNTNEVHVQISTSEEQAHLFLLEAMYKIDILDNANFDELLAVLKLAQKYDVKFVFKKCKYCLHDMMDSLEICTKIIYFIKIDNAIPDVEDLIRTIQSFLAKEFSPLDKTWQTTSFKELCEPLLKYLLSSDELVTVSENTVFHALMYWTEERGIENVLESEELPSLLSVVRFELIPFDYLYNVVQHNPVAKKLMDFNDHYLRGITYHAFSNTVKQRLPHQPVKRKAETQPFVAFTWVIPTHKLDANTPGITDKILKSKEFWYCGYKMRLVIANIVEVRHLGKNFSMFKAKLCLRICNLTQQSEVSIQWQPTSPCFKFFPNEKTETFDRKTRWSSVAIIYEMRVKVAFNKQKGRSTAVRRIRAPAQTSFALGAASSMPTTTFDRVRMSTTKPSFNISAASSMPTTTFDGVRVSTTKPSFNIGAASSTQTTTFDGVRMSTTKPSFNIGAASSMPTTTFDGVRVSTTKPSFNIGAASSTPTTTFDGVRMSTTKPGFNIGAASSTLTTTFDGGRVTTTKPSFNIGAASSTPTITFDGVRMSTTKPSFNIGAASSTLTPTFDGVRMSTTKPSFNIGAASSTPTATFDGVRVSTTKPSFNIGAASSTLTTTFHGVRMSTTKPSFNIGAASSTPTATFDGVRVSTTKPSFNIGSASSTPTATFDGVRVSTTKPSFNIGAASSMPTTTFDGVRVSTTKPSFNIGAASSTPTATFDGVRVSTTKPSFNIGAASSTLTTTFDGGRVPTTKPNFKLGATSSTSSTTFDGVCAPTTQSYFNPGGSSGINTSVAPSSFCNPLFSFGTWSTNTAKANKSDSMSEPESSNSSYVQIDVIMKLV